MSIPNVSAEFSSEKTAWSAITCVVVAKKLRKTTRFTVEFRTF